MSSSTIAAPFRQSGNFFALCLDTFVQFFRSIRHGRFQWREAIEQTRFIASLTLLPPAHTSLPLGARIAPQPRNLSRPVRAQSFTGSGPLLAIVRRAAPFAVY